jgi:hypothetical protein
MIQCLVCENEVRIISKYLQLYSARRKVQSLKSYAVNSNVLLETVDKLSAYAAPPFSIEPLLPVRKRAFDQFTCTRHCLRHLLFSHKYCQHLHHSQQRRALLKGRLLLSTRTPCCWSSHRSYYVEAALAGGQARGQGQRLQPF